MEDISKQTHCPVQDAQGNNIIIDNKILLCNKRTMNLCYVPLNTVIIEEFQVQHLVATQEPFDDTDVQAGDEVEDKDVPDEQEGNKRLWTEPNTKLLIETVKDFDAEFSSGMKNRVWDKVAAKLKSKIKSNLTALQCDNKWKGLKRTYKSIIIHNQTSGQKKRSWQHFDLMHDVLFKKPEISPEATCSSRLGLSVNTKEDKTEDEPSTSDAASGNEHAYSIIKEYVSSFSRKRKIRLSEAEKRHQDKMKRLDRFNNIFDKLVSKISTSEADYQSNRDENETEG